MDSDLERFTELQSRLEDARSKATELRGMLAAHNVQLKSIDGEIRKGGFDPENLDSLISHSEAELSLLAESLQKELDVFERDFKAISEGT